MSRTVSLTFRQASYDQETDKFPVVLITLQHPDIPGIARLSSDPTERLSETPLRYGTESNGHIYLFAPMSVQLPDDVGERAPMARIVIENVSRELVERARSVTTPGTASIQVVLSSSPNDVEYDTPEFDIRGFRGDAESLTLELGLDSLTDEPFPAGVFAPSGFPGLF